MPVYPEAHSQLYRISLRGGFLGFSGQGLDTLDYQDHSQHDQQCRDNNLCVGTPVSRAGGDSANLILYGQSQRTDGYL